MCGSGRVSPRNAPKAKLPLPLDGIVVAIELGSGSGVQGDDLDGVVLGFDKTGKYFEHLVGSQINSKRDADLELADVLGVIVNAESNMAPIGSRPTASAREVAEHERGNYY